MSRYRVMRRDVGGLVDMPHPLRPGTAGCYMHGRSRRDVLANLRRLGVASMGIELVEVGIGDRAMGAA